MKPEFEFDKFDLNGAFYIQELFSSPCFGAWVHRKVFEPKYSESSLKLGEFFLVRRFTSRRVVDE